MEVGSYIGLGIFFREVGRAGRSGCQLHNFEPALNIATMDDLDQQALQTLFELGAVAVIERTAEVV